MKERSDAFICPYCGSTYKLEKPNYDYVLLYFNNHEVISIDSEKIESFPLNHFGNFDDSVIFEYGKCPSCNKTAIEANGIGKQVTGEKTYIHPKSQAKQLPEYIPESIRNDYEEAYSIVHLSPKASATLSRRTMQGMIRNFFEVKPANLYNEIDQISDKISPTVRKTLDAARKIGNIGAHMEEDINTIVDISDGEAEKLIKLNEYLIKNWYIEKHESDLLMQDIQDINDNKQSDKANH